MPSCRISAARLWMSASALSLEPKPVSYTHLDVYKRQGLYGYSMAIGVVIFLFSFALSACVNKATDRDPLEF